MEFASQSEQKVKSIIARMQELKKSPTEILEDGVDANKVEAALKEANVALRDTKGEFRDLDDVILELGRKWEGLSRNTQRYIATIIAGNRQQSRFIALMDNHEETVRLVDAAYNSAGTSTVAFEKKLDNLDTAFAKLETSFEALYLNGGLAKFFTEAVDFGAELVQTFADLGIGGTALTAVIVTLGAKMAIFATSAKIAETRLRGIADAKKQAEEIENTKNRGSLAEMIGAMRAGSVEGKGLLATLKGFAGVLGPAGIFAIGTAIVGGLVYAFTNAERQARKFKEELHEMQSTAASSQKEANDLNELVTKYTELTEKVELTTAEKEELQSVTKQLTDTYPELISGYDAEGNAIARNVDELQEYLNLKRQEAALDKAQVAAKEIEGKTKWRDEESDAVQAEADKFKEAAKQRGLDLEFKQYGDDFLLNTAGMLGDTYENQKKIHEDILNRLSEEDRAFVEGYTKRLESSTENLQKSAGNAVSEYAKSSVDYFLAVENKYAEGFSQAQANLLKTIASSGAIFEAGQQGDIKSWAEELLPDPEDDAANAALMEDWGKKFFELFGSTISSLSDEEVTELSSILNGTTEKTLKETQSFIETLNFEEGSLLDKMLTSALGDKEEAVDKMRDKLSDVISASGKAVNTSEFDETFTQIVLNAVENIDDTTIKGNLAFQIQKLLKEAESQLTDEQLIDLQQLIGEADFTDLTSVSYLLNQIKSEFANVLSDGTIDNFWNGATEGAQAFSEGLVGITAELTSLDEMMSKIDDMTGRMQDGAMTIKDVTTLTELFPELEAADFEATAQGFRLVGSSISELLDGYGKQQKASLETEQALIQEKIAAYDVAAANEQLAQKKALLANTEEGTADYAEIQNEIAELQRQNNEYDESIARLTEIKLILDYLHNRGQVNISVDVVSNAFKDLDASLSKMSSFGDVMQEQSERGQISFNSAISLIEAGYGRLITVQNGMITLNTEATQKAIQEEKEKANAKITASQQGLRAEILRLSMENHAIEEKRTVIQRALQQGVESEQEYTNVTKTLNSIRLEAYKITEEGRITVNGKTNTELETANKTYLNWFSDSNKTTFENVAKFTNEYVSGTLTQIDVLIGAWNDVHKAMQGEQVSNTHAAENTVISSGKKITDSDFDYEALLAAVQQSDEDYTKRYEELMGKQKAAVTDYEKALLEADKQLEAQHKANTDRINDLNGYIDQLEGLKSLDFGAIVNQSGSLPKMEGDAKKTKEAIDDLKNSFNELTSAVGTLSSAYDEYSQKGYFSLETFKSLMDLQPQYLQFLLDENGNLNLNREALNNLIMARTQELGVQQARQIVLSAKEALEEGEITRLLRMANAAEIAADNVWDLVKQELELEKASFDAVDPAIYENLYKQIEAIEQITTKTMSGIGATGSTVEQLNNDLSALGSTLTTLETAVEQYNVNGHISMQTYQELLNLQPYYLNYLMTEDGQMQLNSASYYQLIAAKMEDLAITRAKALVDEISAAVTAGNTERLYELAGATQVATNATWGFVQSQLEAQKAQLTNLLGPEEGTKLYNNFSQQITNIKNLSQAAIQGIGKETLTAQQAQQRLEQQQKKQEQEEKRREEERKRREEKRKQLIDKMENALLNALIARDEKIVDDLRKKYDKMKELDQDYLDSVKEMRAKEKELRESEKELESLSKMKQRLALLERDTSGAYAREIAELKAQIAEKEEEMKEDAKDKTIENLEEEMNKTHERYDDEVEALEKANEAKKENMQLYWDEVNKIMAQGTDAMLETLMKYDKSFQDMSARQKENFIAEMTEAANAVMGIFDDLSSSISSMDFTPSFSGDFGYVGGGGGLDFGSGNNIIQNKPNKPSKPSKPSGGGGSSGSGSGSGRNTARFSGPIYNTASDAQRQKNGINPVYGSGPYTIIGSSGSAVKVRYYKLSSGVTGWYPSSKRYAKGGLVDYTGPAWVDGSKSKPEAFLSAMDTMLMRNFLDGLQMLKGTVSTINQGSLEQDNKPTEVNIEVNVEQISNDYDVQRMVETIKNEIVKSSKYRNTIGVSRGR